MPNPKQRKMAAVFQAKLADNVFKAWMMRNYSQLAMQLEILAGSIGDTETVARIAGIKEDCAFDFESFTLLYLRSLGMPPNRFLRFPGQQRMPWAAIRQRAEVEFVKPLNEVAIVLLSKLSEEVSMQVSQMVEVINAKEGINPVFDGASVIDDIPSSEKG